MADANSIMKIGERYGLLEVVRLIPRSRAANVRAKIVCRCECGSVRTYDKAAFRRGCFQSCGCQKVELIRRGVTRHGKTYSRAHRIWCGLRNRCFNERCPAYSFYGGRGITVCVRWESFENFYEDMGDPPPGASIDRINNDGNYEPSNCRWASKKTQAENRSITRYVVVNGEVVTFAEAARRLGLSRGAILYRVRHGLENEVFIDGRTR